MSVEDLTEAQYLLRKLLVLHGRELALSNPWVSEFDRWKELLFALLVQVLDMPEHRVRRIVGDMADLQLLAVPTLAGLCHREHGPDSSAPAAQQVIDFLRENGVSEAAAERALAAMCQAAAGLTEHWGGRIQRYLRHYGEMMLQDLGRTFRFDTIDEAQLHNAFTYWLQNALNMPLSLVNDDLLEYARAIDSTPAALIEAADELDMNLAVLDDLITLRNTGRPSQSTTSG